LLEQNECLMVCVLWQDDCETTSKEVTKKSTHEDDMKVTMKKFEDKDGCEGKDSIHVISIPMKKFKDQ
jgi:hypothetical protein